MEKRKALSIINETKRNYNFIAKDWNNSRSLPSPVKIKMLQGIKKGFRVLDLGCGNGLMTGEVVKRGGRYFGSDISAKLVSLARKKYVGEIKKKKAQFFVADALNLPFKNNQFDFIFSFSVIHHIPSAELRKKFLEEVFRVLKPRAKVVITSWNLLEDWAQKRFDIKRQLKNIPPGYDKGDVYVAWKGSLWKGPGGKEVPRYIHQFTDKEFKELAQSAGFKKIKIEYYTRAGEKKKNGETPALTLTKTNG